MEWTKADTSEKRREWAMRHLGRKVILILYDGQAYAGELCYVGTTELGLGEMLTFTWPEIEDARLVV